MTLTIIAENRLHKPITDAIRDSSGAIERICAGVDPKNPLYGVDPISDTMFNEYQINVILDYLSIIEVSSRPGSGDVQALRDAASIAARKGGYLWFRAERR